MDAEKVWQEEQCDKSRAKQVDKEDVEDRRLAQPHEIEEIEPDVQEDKQQLQRCKADRPLLKPQIAEWDGLQSIKSHHDSHHCQVVRVLGISKGRADGSNKAEDQQQEYCRECGNGGKRGRKDGVGLCLLVVRKTEKRRLHAKGQQHEDKCRIGIDVGADTVIARIFGHIVGVKRYQQVVQEPAYNTR